MIQRAKYGVISCGLAVATILIQLLLFGVFEWLFSGTPVATQRLLTVIFLVMPPIIGLLVGVIGLVWTDRNKVMAAIGLVLNFLIALFYIFLVSFAG